jgi:hypothetical protein
MIFTLLLLLLLFVVETCSTETCIVVICNNRDKLLRKSLYSILSARGVDERGFVIISQNGNNEQVGETIREEFPELQLIRNDKQDNLKAELRLPAHFKWTFDKVFWSFPQCHKGMVIIEEDLEVSPDFLEYFELTAPVVENDPTLLTTSLWNDIGFEWNSNDKNMILRTTFFPGLGWWLSRSLWFDVLREEWPSQDWDWYVRKKAFAAKLDTIHPEVPRDYHMASHGTYMRMGLFKKYFEKININRDVTFTWHEDDVIHMSSFQTYHDYIRTRIENGNQINTIGHVMYGIDNIVWMEGLTNMNRRVTKRCDKFFSTTGIWSNEMIRSDWYGVKIVWYQPTNSHLIIIDHGRTQWQLLRWPVARVFRGVEICDDFNN